MDGTRQTHDLYRTGPEGDGTFQTVMRAIRILREHRVEYNILTVVTAQAARRAEEIYRFYAHHDLRYQQYIPCLDPLGEARGQHVYSLTPEDFEKFLKEQFACWYQDIMHGRFVYNRYFDNLVGMLLRRPPESCGMMGECGRQLVVEADGSVYPCDFYVLDRYRLGSLNVNSLKEVEQKRDALGFVDGKGMPYLPLVSSLPGRLPPGPGTSGRHAGAELLLQSLSGIFRICHFRTRTGGPAGADGRIRFLTPQKRSYRAFR